MKFELNGQSIEISDGKCNFWNMCQEFYLCMQRTQNEFEQKYTNMGNLSNLSDKYFELVDLVDDSGYRTVCLVLEKYGGIRLTGDEYDELFGVAINMLDNSFQRYDDEIWEELSSAERNKVAKKAYRKGRRQSRTRWRGYGVEGKTKAALLNTGSGMIHGTVNFAGNVATDVMTSAKMNLAFNDTRRIKAMKSDIKLFFDELQKITNSIMENNSFKPFEAILIKDSKKAEKKIESLSELEEKDDNYTKRILESLALDPSLRFIYELIVDKFGDKDNKVSNFAKKFDINIDEWKVKRLKEQLKKNKETNLYDENRILIAIDKVKAECAFWGIPFNEYTKELEELWTNTNTLL